MVLFDLYLFNIREGLSYLSKMKQLPNLKHAKHRLQLLQHHYAITKVMMPNWSSCCIDLLPNKTIWCIMEKVPEFFFPLVSNSKWIHIISARKCHIVIFILNIVLYLNGLANYFILCFDVLHCNMQPSFKNCNLSFFVISYSLSVNM